MIDGGLLALRVVLFVLIVVSGKDVIQKTQIVFMARGAGIVF